MSGLSDMARAMVEYVAVGAIKEMGTEIAMQCGGVDWHYASLLKQEGTAAASANDPAKVRALEKQVFDNVRANEMEVKQMIAAALGMM